MRREQIGHRIAVPEALRAYVRERRWRTGELVVRGTMSSVHGYLRHTWGMLFIGTAFWAHNRFLLLTVACTAIGLVQLFHVSARIVFCWTEPGKVAAADEKRPLHEEMVVYSTVIVTIVSSVLIDWPRLILTLLLGLPVTTLAALRRCT